MSDFDHEDDSSVLSEPPSDIPPSSSDSETGLLSEPGTDSEAGTPSEPGTDSEAGTPSELGTDSEDQLSGNPLFKKLK